ncbi:retrovirus-related pol polyprotein from transposon TNT 1-94 [Tanacetum coccineum]
MLVQTQSHIVWHGSCSLARVVQSGTGRAVWHGSCSLARGVQFSMDRAVWHEPEQYSSELNNLSFDPVDCHDYHSRGYHIISCVDYIPHLSFRKPCLYSLFVRVVCVGAIYRTEVCTEIEDYIRRSFRSLWQKPNLRRLCCYYLCSPRVGQALLQQLVRTDTWAEGMTEGRKHNRNKSKSWKIRGIKQLEILMTHWYVALRKWLRIVLWIIYLLRRRVRMVPSTLRLISVGQLDEEGYHVGFGDQQWKVTKGSLVVARGNKRESLYMVEVHPEGIDATINGSGNATITPETWWFGKAEESFLHNVSEDKETAKVRANLAEHSESTGIHAEALKMLWADSVSTTYLTYRIPYVPIRLRILEEEWRGKDTSLVHLKVFGCDSFVKVKDVCGEAMKCTFIGSGSNEMRYSFRDTKSHQVISEAEISHLWTRFMEPENDSIVCRAWVEFRNHSDTSEGSKNKEASRIVEDQMKKTLKTELPTRREASRLHMYEDSTRESRAPVRYSPSANYLLLIENGEPEFYSEALSSKESVEWKKAIIEKMVSLEKNQTCSLVRLPAGKKASQRLWMFREPSYVGALNDTSTQHKSEGFQLVGQKENLECILKEILYGLIQAPRLRYLKFDSFMQKDKAPTWQSSTSLIDSWNEELCRDVHQVGDEREVEVLRNFNWPPSELITEYGVLPERVLARGRAVWHGSCSLARGMQFSTDRAVWHEPEQYSSELA